MTKIGITGGIGSGKTFVCEALVAMGVPIYDCDARAKALIANSAEIRTQIERLTPLNDLATYLFASDDNAACINAIVHPAVRKDFRLWANELTTDIIGMERAILYECGLDSEVDRVLCITAPEDVRIERIMKRDRCTEDAARQRMARQRPDEALQRAQDTLNNVNKQNTIAHVKDYLSHLR